MGKYKTYGKYKDSGIPWLGEVPEHWEVKRAKRIFQELSVKGFPNEPLLAATQTKGVVLKSKYENRTVVAQNNLETLKLVEPGDFVISLRSFQGGIELAHDRGIISPAYTVLRLRDENQTGYFKYLLKSREYIKSLTLLVTGIREGQNIDTNKFKESQLFTPTPSEQTTIARFLDYKLAKINRFIRKKKQLIKLLNEQKAAIINQAVTKGLDPHVPMKDSGIEWLGEIPEHWEVRKLKYVASFNPSKGNSNFSKNDLVEVVFLPMEKVSDDGRIDCEIKLPISQVWEGYTFFQRGDVVFAKITPCFENGKGAYLSELETEIGFGTTEFTVLRPDTKLIDGNYLHMILNSKSFRKIGERFMEGAAGQKRIPTDFVKNFAIAVPQIEEQFEIIAFIRQETTTISTTISKIEKEIALVEEYKTVLVAEAVTGKIDVRGFEVPEMESEEESYEEIEEEMSMAAEDAGEFEPEEAA